MSAFLGMIHYMLYNKIQLQENILEGIEKYAKDKEIETDKIIEKINAEFGYPERRSLEEVIDNGNIHGWLQEKIQSVEKRTAALVTELKDLGLKVEELGKIYYKNGIESMEKLEAREYSPEEIFNLIYSHLLEGMPCDRINQPVDRNENEYIWKTTRCIHKDLVDIAKGDINDFYILRDYWIEGFLSEDKNKYSYTRTSDGYNIIRREI